MLTPPGPPLHNCPITQIFREIIIYFSLLNLIGKWGPVLTSEAPYARNRKLTVDEIVVLYL